MLGKAGPGVAAEAGWCENRRKTSPVSVRASEGNCLWCSNADRERERDAAGAGAFLKLTSEIACLLMPGTSLVMLVLAEQVHGFINLGLPLHQMYCGTTGRSHRLQLHILS